MPNLNAALGKAQIENLEFFISEKRSVAERYIDFFNEHDISFVSERPGTVANYWLNTILLDNHMEKFELNPIGTCVLVPEFQASMSETDSLLQTSPESPFVSLLRGKLVK